MASISTQRCFCHAHVAIAAPSHSHPQLPALAFACTDGGSLDPNAEAAARLRIMLSAQHSAVNALAPEIERVAYPGKRAFAVVVCKTEALAQIICTRKPSDKPPHVPHIRWVLNGLHLNSDKTGVLDSTLVVNVNTDVEHLDPKFSALVQRPTLSKECHTTKGRAMRNVLGDSMSTRGTTSRRGSAARKPTLL
eukprot:6760610-Prymnesium_polylepis.2